MPMMTSQIFKSANFTKTRKSRYLLALDIYWFLSRKERKFPRVVHKPFFKQVLGFFPLLVLFFWQSTKLLAKVVTFPYY